MKKPNAAIRDANAALEVGVIQYGVIKCYVLVRDRFPKSQVPSVSCLGEKGINVSVAVLCFTHWV